MAKKPKQAKRAAPAEHDEASAEYQRGMNELRKQLGPMADAYVQNIKAVAPEFAWVNVTFPFAELYTRDVLDMKTRELCTGGGPDGPGLRPSPAQAAHRRGAALRCLA